MGGDKGNRDRALIHGDQHGPPGFVTVHGEIQGKDTLDGDGGEQDIPILRVPPHQGGAGQDLHAGLSGQIFDSEPFPGEEDLLEGHQVRIQGLDDGQDAAMSMRRSTPTH